MKTRASTCRPLVLGGADVLLVAIALHAQVVVHPHACVVGQRTFSDLDAQIAAVPARGTGTVAVTDRGSGAIPVWLATVQRLSEFRLEIDVLDASAPVCATPAGPVSVSQGTGGSLAGIDSAAVERYWGQVQPQAVRRTQRSQLLRGTDLTSC